MHGHTREYKHTLSYAWLHCFKPPVIKYINHEIHDFAFDHG